MNSRSWKQALFTSALVFLIMNSSASGEGTILEAHDWDPAVGTFGWYLASIQDSFQTRVIPWYALAFSATNCDQRRKVFILAGGVSGTRHDLSKPGEFFVYCLPFAVEPETVWRMRVYINGNQTGWFLNDRVLSILTQPPANPPAPCSGTMNTHLLFMRQA